MGDQEIYADVVGYCGVEGVYVYDSKRRAPVFVDLPPQLDEADIKKSISVYLAKSQEIIDVIPEFVAFHGHERSLLLARHGSLWLGCLYPAGCDLRLIMDKAREVWLRIETGV
jgi:hypothetical protein